MKKIIALVLALMLVLSVGVLFAHADETNADVLVTIADKDGKLALTAEKVTVTDIDGDSALTINDALYAAHEQFYEGGAAAGYSTETTKWGLSLMKLWGEANGGSYGYMVNNIPAWSLTDPVKADDYIAAFVYTDTNTYNDRYAYFDQLEVNLTQNASLELTLTKNDYDSDGNNITLPVKGATLTVDGASAGVITDADGKATIDFTKNGKFLISATADDQVLVPPVCLAEVKYFDPDPAEVKVTIADKDGKLVVAAEAVTVTDCDDDKELTVNDALYAAHEQFYEGGAAAGYSTEMTKWGLSLMKLWGEANGGSYGYTVNNIASNSLADPIEDGDYVAAYVYTDTETFADKYAFFDVLEAELTDTDTLNLTLMKNDFDADWNPVTMPVVGAEITIDGEPAGVVTDNEGKATVTFTSNGRFLISAIGAEGQVIVPPVCVADVAFFEEPEDEEPGSTTEEPPAVTADDQEVPEPEEPEAVRQPDEEEDATEPEDSDITTPDEATPDSVPSDTPATGDSTKLWLWILIVAVCAAGACTTIIVYKKSNAE